MTLEERCQKFLLEAISENYGHLALEIVPHLVAFVTAEIGRAAGGGQLDKSLPLCLYFSDEQEREEFIAAVMATKLNLRAKRLP